jgi:hypothetical protein
MSPEIGALKKPARRKGHRREKNSRGTPGALFPQDPTACPQLQPHPRTAGPREKEQVPLAVLGARAVAGAELVSVPPFEPRARTVA